MFLLCFISLRESRLVRPRRHVRVPYYELNAEDELIGCGHKTSTEDLPMEIGDHQSRLNSQKRHFANFAGLKSFLRTNYPLLAEKEIKLNGEKIFGTQIKDMNGHKYVAIEFISAKPNGSGLDADMVKGYIDFGYQALTKIKYIEYCDGKITNHLTTLQVRPLKEHELQKLLDEAKKLFI